MATGVLIMGVGKGTKQLQSFLECTKSYEAVVLFGAATDTYDVLGKVLRRAEYKHVTREGVERALERFRGKIMQRPPIYSALRVEGKRLYEYAREGKEVPRAVEERPVEVRDLEVVEWLEGGEHGFRWPEEEAEMEAKAVAEKVLHFGERGTTEAGVDGAEDATNGVKRKRGLEDGGESPVSSKKPDLEDEETDPETLMSGGLQPPDEAFSEAPEPRTPPPTTPQPSAQSSSPTPDKGPPAVKLRMTVTSGFYVRSLAHDLGEAVGSLACMSELVRTRQEKFELGKNVLEYDNLEKGEEVWGPEVKRLIEEREESTQDFSSGEKAS